MFLYVFARKIKYHVSYHKMRRLLYYKMLQPYFQNAQVITKRVVSTHCHKTTNWKKGQPRSLKTNFISTIDTPKLIMNGPLNHCVIFNPTIAIDLSSPKTCKVRKWKRISVVNKSYFIVLGYKAVVFSESDILTFCSSRQNLTMSKQLSTFGYLLNCEITYRGNRIN